MNPHLVLTIVFGALSALMLLLGIAQRTKRVLHLAAAVLFGAAAGAAWADGFWPMVSLGMLGAWAAYASFGATRESTKNFPHEDVAQVRTSAAVYGLPVAPTGLTRTPSFKKPPSVTALAVEKSA